MNTTKRIGIWMDHSTAHALTLMDGVIESQTIESDFTHQKRGESLAKSEDIMHNKEQKEQEAYFNKIGEKILEYNEVVLFGPTNAKAELFNSISNNHRFNKIKIEVIAADKMTPPQMNAFVLKHFSA